MNPRVLLAELFGTFVLTLTVLISINNPGFPVPTPVITALTIGALVYMIGPVSGCPVNPSITISVLSIGKIGLQEAGAYIIAQLVGAGLGLAIGGALFADPAALNVSSSAMTGVAELLGTFVLGFGVATVVIGRVSRTLGGLVIGLSLLSGLSWAAHGSNGVINPAVAFGIGSFSLAYVWGPIVGAAIGAQLARFLCDPGAEAGATAT